MNGPSQNEYPDEDFEIIEVDFRPHLTEEQKLWPVVRCESAEEEFAIEEPLPALDVRVVVAAAPGRRLPALVVLFSDQEAALGGGGLDLARQTSDNGAIHATLLPRSVEGARGRLERVAKWAAALAPEVAVTVV